MGFDYNDILVIAPFKAQVAELSRVAAVTGWTAPIKTIDKAQGAEAEVVIFCFTRTAGNLGFLRREKRINMATSTAREVFFIVGNYDYIQETAGHPFRQYLSALKPNRTTIRGNLGWKLA
ncbi:MAG: hypothetical protein M1819_003979 [Sarea resinae]|nr:MAG: hypothetical protein M1819_003979 [Sarea resinae]